MTHRLRIFLFVIFLLCIVALPAGWAYYIYSMTHMNMEHLVPEIKEDVILDKLNISFSKIVLAVRNKASYGDERTRSIYEEEKQKTLVLIEQLDQQHEGKSPEALVLLKKNLLEFLEHSDALMREKGVLKGLRWAEEENYLLLNNAAIFGHFESLNSESMAVVSQATDDIRLMKGQLDNYLFLMVLMILGMFALYYAIVRRFFALPLETLLKATGQIASGRLEYRIAQERKDEFGVIFRRFDEMASSLERASGALQSRLAHSEILLAISNIPLPLDDLEGTLKYIVENISSKLGRGLCALYIYDLDQEAFVLRASNLEEGLLVRSVPANIPVIKRLVQDKSGLRVQGDGASDSFIKAPSNYIAMPTVYEGACNGILLIGDLGDKAPLAQDMDVEMMLALSVGVTIKSYELHAETRNQLQQISALYELGKAVASVYQPEDMLKTIVWKIARLIKSKGCIIRLLEGEDLKVTAYYGPIEQENLERPLPLGKGVAGWVAREGRPLIVADVSKLPEELRYPTVSAQTVLVVPLKKDEEIIGTLGLYDRLDDKGEVIAFNQSDLSVAEGFASLSAIAIDKARMQDREKRIQEEMLKTEKRMELLFDSVQSGIITLDRDYNIKSANRYVDRWVDVPHEDIILKDAREVFHKRGGICPHCAASVTFQEGGINTITQSSGINYADLSSYPIKDAAGNVVEAVVFIQDITDRVIYQEEIMGLYREVMRTKEYMESLIRNSADAIITTDLSGLVKSWNPSAEAIYGFSRDDVLEKFVPYVPESLLEGEKSNFEKIRRGEVLKLETFRKRADGSLIEVSMTISPIKDVSGEIMGISSISRDITDKKRVESELVRRNQELSRLFFISSAMRGTLDLDRLLRMVLTAVTMSDGLGFNRAILFLVDEEAGLIKGTTGVGPLNINEAMRIWHDLSIQKRTLHEIMSEVETGPVKKDSLIDRIGVKLEVPLESDTVLARTVRQKTTFNVRVNETNLPSDEVLLKHLGTEAYATVPLVSRGRVIGVLWVDNQFNKRPITQEDIKFLTGFADQVASAVEAAWLFQKVSLAEAELENIFSSISDMVYFTDNEYTIRNVNEAVVKKIGLERSKIIGKKCYEVFHGMDHPFEECPHHKTVEELKPFVEEVEDKYLRGTFISSTAPMFSKERQFLGTVHVVRDISEIKQLRVRLQSSERMAALGEMAAKVAHEIRNPLVSVGGFAKRLEGKLEGGMKEYATIIAQEVGRLELILKDILGFVREVRMHRRIVDLNEILKDLAELLHTEFQRAGNRVVLDLSPSGVVMNVDPDRLREAIMNIIVNANQATLNGTIVLRTYTDAGRGVIEVDDTGSGVLPDDAARIFDPFYTTRTTGTGLGLAVSKRIVEENGGLIEFTNKETGKGTIFRIYLPLKEAIQ